jgi:pilus assembly protein Flp/PilA
MLAALESRKQGRERGASAVEYGLLIAGIAALIVIVIFAFSGRVTGLFSDSCTSIDAVANTGAC